MAGSYNAGQSPIRTVLVDPTTLVDITPATSAADGSTRIAGVSGTAISSATNPTATRDYGFGNIAVNQVSVQLTSTQIVAARSSRGAVTIVNHGTNPVYIGTGTASATTGLLLPGVVGASVTIPSNAQIAGIATGAAQTVSYLETF